MKRTLSALALLSGFATAQVAMVDDPSSPGTLGDQHLSLDEAIRLCNGTLTPAQLSAAELARLSGGVAPTEIRVDGMMTPTITLQQPLSTLDGPPGIDVMLMGMGPRPVIDAGGLPVALHIRSNQVMVQNLRIQGGQVGVRIAGLVTTTMNRMVMLDEVEVTGQSAIGVEAAAAGMMAMTPVMLQHSHVHGMPTAIRIDDQSNGGQVMFNAEWVDLDNVQLGVDLFCGASGNMTMCRMFRCTMSSGTQLLKVRRGATNDSRIMAMLVGGDFHTSGDTIDAQGNDIVETAVHVHHSIIQPDAGRKAFLVGPQNARIDFHISENIVYGDIDVQEGRLNRRLWAWNNVFHDGVLSFSNLGTPTSYRWNRFQNCTIRALPSNASRLLITSSEFDGCTLDGQSALGGIELENCFSTATSLSGNALDSFPAPSRWLATSFGSNETPSVGSYVDLTLDIPDGIAGAWQFGLTDKNVVLTQEPFRFYANQALVVFLPGVFVLRTTMRLPIPNAPALVGLEMYAAPVTAPYRGQTWPAPYFMPRGVYLSIRP